MREGPHIAPTMCAQGGMGCGGSKETNEPRWSTALQMLDANKALYEAANRGDKAAVEAAIKFS